MAYHIFTDKLKITFYEEYWKYILKKLRKMNNKEWFALSVILVNTP